MVALAFVPPHMDCAMHICKASAATAKFGFQGVGVFLAGRWASKAATSSICSAASNIGYKSEALKSTMPSSSMCLRPFLPSTTSDAQVPAHRGLQHRYGAFCYLLLNVWLFVMRWWRLSTFVANQVSTQNLLPPIV